MRAEARQLDDVLLIRDQLQAAIHLYKRQASMALGIEAAEMKLLAEQKLGEFLVETVNHKGNRGVDDTMLPALLRGVTKKQSSRRQMGAEVPELDFDEFLETATERSEVPTTANLLRVAKQNAGVMGAFTTPSYSLDRSRQARPHQKSMNRR